jgi:Flp pilus assembly protein TadG
MLRHDRLPWGKMPARRAAAATELAVVLPFLTLVFAATLDFARVYSAAQTVDQCASAGAMYACGAAWVPGSEDTATRVKYAACAEGASLSPALQASNVTVAIATKTVTVTVEYDCEMITPFLNTSKKVHLTRTVTMNRLPTAGN